ADIDARLAAGTDVLVNGSRAYLAQARRRYRDLVPVMLTVEAGILRQRLIARGREDERQIDSRLARNGHYGGVAHGGLVQVGEVQVGEAGNILTLDNSGPVEDTIQRLYGYLYPAQLTRLASQFAGHSHAPDSAGHGGRRPGARLQLRLRCMRARRAAHRPSSRPLFGIAGV